MASIFETAGIKVEPEAQIKAVQQAQSLIFPNSMQIMPTADKKDIVAQLSGILSRVTYNGPTDMQASLANNATKDIEYKSQKMYNPGLSEPLDYRLPQNATAEQISAKDNSILSIANSSDNKEYVGEDFRKLDKRQYDDKINKYFNTYVNSISDKKLSKDDISNLKNNFTDYVKSDLFAQRQAMNPDVYQSGQPVSEEFQRGFADFVAKSKQSKRLSLIDELPINIVTNSKQVGQYMPKQGTAGKIDISQEYPASVLAHELSHGGVNYNLPFNEEQKALIEKNKGVLPEGKERYSEKDSSDIVNSNDYYNKRKSNNAKDLSKDVSPMLNNNEVNKLVKLAKGLEVSNWDDASLNEDTHYDKSSKDKIKFAGEQYSDLNGVRKLLLDNGITKSFGEDLDKGKIEKAINNPAITKDPVFRRFYHRYGEDNIIELNNTIAMNKKSNVSKNTMA